MILSTRVALALMAAYVVVGAVIVFWPNSDLPGGAVETIASWWDAPQWLGVRAGWKRPIVQFGTNVLLFMPLSFLGHSFRPRWGWLNWTLFGLLLSVSVELLQMLLLPDRTPQLKDLVSNALGALLGYLLVRSIAAVRA